ncbi:MAG: large-conductance mechanosensitive channel protein MscL [Chloroflexi bacterium]|nr:large-conductance mechanosensitive channel protein MscL [Chloroflexota bacterium]
MSMWQEFKDFIARGNVVDMAVGIIIGGAFGKVVSSFVNDILMPPIGLLLGGVDFSNLAITLKAASGDNPAVLLRYGAFIQTLVDFLIIALAIFVMIKGINALKREEEAKEAEPETPPAPDPEVVLLEEIRDLLKQQR